MKRRIVSLVLALTLMFGLATTANAYTSKQYRAADALYHLDLFQGRTETGKDFDLDSGLNRAEGTLMVIRLLGREEEAYTRNLANTPFPDVADFWNGKAPFIAYAYEEGLMNGVTTYANGVTTLTFEPRAAMNDRMYLTLILRVLGYPDENNNIWKNAWTLAYEAGLVDSTEKDTEFTRGDAALVAWKALGCTLYGSNKTLAQKLMGEGLFNTAEYTEAIEIWIYGAIQDDESSTPTTPSVPDSEEDDTESTSPDSDSSTESSDDEVTYEEYNAMTGDEQQAFMATFESIPAFFEWYNAAKAEYEAANPPIEIGGNGSIDWDGPTSG